MTINKRIPYYEIQYNRKKKEWGRSLYSIIKRSFKIYHWVWGGKQIAKQCVFTSKTTILCFLQFGIFCNSNTRKKKTLKGYAWGVLFLVTSGEGERGPSKTAVMIKGT